MPILRQAAHGALWSSLLFVVACAPQAPHLDSPGSTLVCFGDSITYGVGAGDDPTYPQLLSEHLGVEALNAGVPGDTTADGLARIDELLELNPWLVVVELGGNDLLQRRPRAAVEADLREILEILLEERVLPVLVRVEGPFGYDYGDLFHQLAEEYQLPLLDEALPEILRSPRLKADPIHPNAAGYEVLAEEVAELLRPLLRARRKALAA